MTQVETVRGLVDVADLGTTLMHEHVFVLNEEIRQNYPDYWDEVADAGCLLGMDRFGIGRSPALEVRASVIAELCRRGYAGQIVLSHDASCFIDWYPHDESAAGNYTYIHDHVLPALAERGVTAEQVDAMLVANPRRYFTTVT